MARKKTSKNRLPLTGRPTGMQLNPLRAGMPAMDAVHAVTPLTRAGATYKIIRTTETDGYESTAPAVKLSRVLRRKGPPPMSALAAALAAKPPKGDNYAGTDRKKAKLSVGTGNKQAFSDMKALIGSLTPESKMINHKPPIPTAATSGRVVEEQRNVSVSAFLYASSREADNDFHLIVGRDHKLTPEMYMTVEVSGLPPKNAPAFSTLDNSRKAFKNFFGNKLPGFTYDFYDPPIPVQIEGSLFFDMTHATGTRPGPQSLKSRMPTIWEIHPVTSIKLG